MESYTIVFLSIGTLMFLIGFCVLVKFFSLYSEARKSSSWPEIQAKVVKSGMKTDEREVGLCLQKFLHSKFYYMVF